MWMANIVAVYRMFIAFILNLNVVLLYKHSGDRGPHDSQKPIGFGFASQIRGAPKNDLAGYRAQNR